LLNFLKQRWLQMQSRLTQRPVHIFMRHCHFSDVSAHKARLPGFSREACFENLLSTIAGENVQLHLLLDTFRPMEGEHFIKKQHQFPITEMRAGSEAAAFLLMLEYVLKQDLAPDAIVYFLEDDYLHRQGWVSVLREGFTLPGVDYITLYDHKDKYFFPQYVGLQSKLFQTPSTHWRTTPSTTNTYAMRFATLQKHIDTHRAFSLGRKISDDHQKFCQLSSLGATLISPIPGWSTHCEPDYASPCIDWQEILQAITSRK